MGVRVPGDATRAIRWGSGERARQAHRRCPHLRRLGPVARPRARGQGEGPAEGGRRRVVRDPARRDAGPRRRVRLRQVHGRAVDRGPPRSFARNHRVRRCRARGARGRLGACGPPAAGQAIDADDLPGSLREPQSALARVGHRRRADPRAGRPTARCSDRRACARPARAGGSRGGGWREVPAPVLRRAAPAHLDRTRARDRTGVHRLRRAALGTRRVGAGAGAEPDARWSTTWPTGSAACTSVASSRSRRHRRCSPRPRTRTRGCCSTRCRTFA